MFDLSALAKIAPMLSAGLPTMPGLDAMPDPGPTSAPLGGPEPSASPQPMPTMMPQQPQQASPRDMLLQLAPMVLSMFVARKNPMHAAAIMRGMAQGQDAARVQMLDAQQREQHRKDTAAKFMQEVAADAQQFDDPVEFQKYLQFAEQVGQSVGVEPGSLTRTIAFPASKTAKVTQAKAAARVKELQTLYGDKLSDPEVQGFSVTFDGKTLKVSELMNLAGLQIRKADGSSAADVLTPKGKNEPAGTETERAARLLAGIRDAKARGDVQKAAELQASYDDLMKVKRDYTSTANVGSFEDYVQRKYGANPSAAQIASARREYGDAGRAAPVTVNLTGGGPGDPVDIGARAVIEGRMAPSQAASLYGGYGKEGAAFKRALVTRIQQLQPDFNFQAAESGYQFGKSPGTQTTVRMIDNIMQTIPVLEHASREFQRSNIRFINKGLLAGKSQVGNVNVAQYQAALLGLSDEVAKILSGGGTGSTTSDAKLRQAQELLAGDYTPQQLAGVISTIKEMLTTRRGSLTKDTFMEKPGNESKPATLKFNPATGKVERK